MRSLSSASHSLPNSSKRNESTAASLLRPSSIRDFAEGELAPLHPAPSLDRKLSSSEISKRVAARVAERNSWPEYSRPSGWSFLKYGIDHRQLFKEFQDEMIPENFSEEFPLQAVDFEALRNPPKDSIQVTWIGHATVLAQMGGWNILTDPVFSARCSAVQWFGPERFQDAACTVQDLATENVPIHVTLVSHNHYDHLDYNSIHDLAESYPDMKFVVPLGLQRWFESNISNSRGSTVQLDWHETFSHPSNNSEQSDVDITAVPMMHWSNRNGLDRDKSLWCGFGVKAGKDNKQNFLFTGDTGWFGGLQDIGCRYGPYDIAAIPIGAYHPRNLMRQSHMNPEEAVDMMSAVGARKAVPIHWGSFPLTLEPVLEPRDRLVKAMKASQKDPSTFPPLLVGETVVSKI
eukprot:CAMPEP_0195294520 /NCGR_PEP_ID=MMETSP0707-20130614/15233_1 /TAXON_ID=33640 /ORGANISM="Asterionellopsis glacialis, Strain CCMP134" /LENGTH=403 /DNA_ID=CAMNT_0040355515 /DNA_START=145 /DNA_END=1356 /DNA_ORIENTATION=+